MNVNIGLRGPILEKNRMPLGGVNHIKDAFGGALLINELHVIPFVNSSSLTRRNYLLATSLDPSSLALVLKRSHGLANTCEIEGVSPRIYSMNRHTKHNQLKNWQ